MRKVLCTLLVVFVLFPSIIASASAPALDTADLEIFLDRVINEVMDDFKVPNLTISVVAGGEVAFARGYGYADIEKGTPVEPDKTLFRIGSTSKLFTWTAVMQLVEQGKLDLDVDVNEYLDFEIPSRLEHGRGRVEIEPITLRHLMNHTPGFESYMTGIFALSQDHTLSLEQYVRERRPARVYPPGEVTAYSNYGSTLAGYIVQLVSGVPFHQYIEENIYRPLAMENSSFREPLPSHLEPNMSKPYRYVNGEFRQGKFEFNPGEPAGSMSSTATDMAKFMLAYLKGGQLHDARILEEATIQGMFKGEMSQHPRVDGMAHGFIKGNVNGTDLYHHPGGTMLYNSKLYLLPDEEVGFFISHSGGSYLANMEIFQQFMDRYFPSEALDIPQPAAGMKERSQAFVGEYHQNRRTFTTPDKFLSAMIGVIRVDVDDEGYLLVTHNGETNRFVEIEPGIYHSLREGRSPDFGGDFRTIAFATDFRGRTMLMSDGPMSYSKATWYERGPLIFGLLAFSLLFIIGSLIYWGIKSLVLKLRKKKVEVIGKASWAKRAAVTNGVLTFLFLFGFLEGMEPDPLYELPASAYTPPSTLTSILDFAPYGIALVTLAIAVFTVLSWKQGYWKLAGRIHYTIFALASVALTWIFYFLNAI